MDIVNECEVLRKEFNSLADRHNMLVDENKKLKIQLEYKDTILEFIQSLKTTVPEPKIVDIAKSNRPQMSFTIVKRTNRTHAK
jgi:hypothetical protein